ncbi:hypothetical protein KOAAANKH_03787 [Brevundimonas sp. NIBR10]|nr:hypothetical protein KOAAANKH_03787 [Brevundimonas sp. NIBR10]
MTTIQRTTFSTFGAALASACIWLASPSSACSPPADRNSVEGRDSDLRAVTVIYEARIENVVASGPYQDNLDFTVRPTAAIWGPVSPQPYRLFYEVGACTNWVFIGDEQAEGSPPNGLKVIVMANPEGLADRRWLYILRAGADYTDFMLRAWQSHRGGQPLRGRQ